MTNEMTRQDEIKAFCATLQNLWLSRPELRFGQLIRDAFDYKADMFYTDDDLYLEFLKETYGQD